MDIRFPTITSIASFMFADWTTKFAVLFKLQQKLPPLTVLYHYQWGNFTFMIVPVFNEGAAFGMFSRFKHVLLAARLAFVAGISVFLFLRRNTISPSTKLAFALICGGAIGNIGDVIFHSHVIDFISFSYNNFLFPAFNLADTFIALGSLILCVKICLSWSYLRSSN